MPRKFVTSRRRPKKAPRNDAIILRGEQRLVVLSTGAGGAIAVTGLNLTVAAFGDRPASIGANFLRWRIKNLIFKYRSNTGTSQVGTTVGVGLLAYGVVDDTTVTAAAISTADQIVNLRKHSHTPYWKDSSLQWSPLDKNKWYYINAESSASDVRETTPGAVVAVSDLPGDVISVAAGVIDVRYEIEFAGSTIVAV